MKSVDIIISSSINWIGGPVGTLKRILNNKEYFEFRGYHISIFTFESVVSGPFEDISMVPVPHLRTPKVTMRMKVSSLLRKIAMHNKLLTDLIIWKKYKKTKELIKYYVSLQRNPEIVECHSHYDGSHYLKYRKNDKPKCVVFLHSNGIPYDQEFSTFPLLPKTLYFKKLKAQCDYMLKHVNLLSFIANKGLKNFQEHYPNHSNTIVIRNGIDDLNAQQVANIEIIRKENESENYKYRLCCVGTISYRKGQRFIIETMHALPPEALKDIHIDFIGEGPERPILEEMINKYKLNEHVCFCGAIPNAEVYKYLAKSNIYILMSQNEGLPISILEAMRVGLPIISTNVAGIPECVDEGYNGILLEPDDHRLTNMLKNLADYNWNQMGKNSREKFEKEFTFDRMKKEFCDMFDLLTNN